MRTLAGRAGFWEGVTLSATLLCQQRPGADEVIPDSGDPHIEIHQPLWLTLIRELLSTIVAKAL